MSRNEDALMSKFACARMSFMRACAALAAGALLAACTPGTEASTSTSAAPPSPTEVHITHLSKGPITRVVTLPAQVLPDQQATLYPKASGYLQTLAAARGGR